MLKTPPGISKRKNESKPLDEAGAVFEDLYKKYLSLDADNLQKRAENYLLKTFYNKSLNKNNSAHATSDFSEPRKLQTAQSHISECVADPVDNFRKNHSADSAEFVKGAKLVETDLAASRHSLEPGLSVATDTVKDPEKDLSHLNDRFRDSRSSTSTQRFSYAGEDTQAAKPETSLKEKVRFEDQQPVLPLDAKREPERTSKVPNPLNKPRPRDGREDTRIFVDDFSESDVSEESVEPPKTKERNYLTVAQVGDCENLDRVDEYLSPSNADRGKYGPRDSVVAKSKELTFTSVVCILFQTLVFLVILGAFFLVCSFPLQAHVPFLKILLPFLVHFGAFYLVFTLTDFRFKKALLVYTNDITLEILSRRLNRELFYRKLSRHASLVERVLVFAALVIACLPVNFTTDFTAFAAREYFYLALNVVFLFAHLAFTYYYFNVRFKKLLTYKGDED